MKQFFQVQFFLLVSFFFVNNTLKANAVGSDFEIFNPALGVRDFVTVESAKTLLPGRFSLGATLDYISNSLPYGATNIKSSKREGFGDDSTLMVAHFGFAVGLTRYWELGLSIPTVLSQDLDSKHGSSNKPKGLLEVRAQTKFAFINSESFGLALIGRANLSQNNDNPFIGKDPEPGFSSEVAINLALSSALMLGINTGYQWRGQGDATAGTKLLKNSMLFSSGLAYSVSEKSKLVFEYYMDSARDKNITNSTDRKLRASEVLLALHSQCIQNMDYTFGLATETGHGLGTADWRIFLGAGLKFGGEEPKRVAPTPRPMPLPAPTPIIADAMPSSSDVITIHDITFAVGSAVIGSDSKTKTAIDSIVASLKAGDFRAVEVAGHSDSTGNANFNLQLSQKRAEAVKSAIIKKGGFDGKKINAKGYGSTQAIASNDTADGRAKNRRVEIKIDR